MLPVSIKNLSPHPLPTYQTPGASGVDIHAWLKEPMLLEPLQRAAIPTGLYVQIPQGFEAQVRPRSGNAIKKGITCLNTPGTIDSDYRGEIQVILINLSNQQQVIKDGDRIAQLVFCAVEKIAWQEVTQLQHTNRQEGGFGHTGE